jgi:hypothetical protein
VKWPQHCTTDNIGRPAISGKPVGQISGEKNQILVRNRTYGGVARDGNGGTPDAVDLLQFSDKAV